MGRRAPKEETSMKRGAATFLAALASAHLLAQTSLVTGFEASQGYTGSATGVPLTGQQGWTLPAGSVDHNIFTYAGNAPGFVAHPTGGGAQFASGSSQGGTLFSRAEHTLDWTASDIW